MPSQEAPEDDDVRQTYNFAPGYYGLVYRAEGPAPHHGPSEKEIEQDAKQAGKLDEKNETTTSNDNDSSEKISSEPQYKLQAMKWGLVPFWTKRNPDYGSMMRTINCRDDSLANTGGMWQHVKQKKRCIVIAQGFYEWLKKDGGKTKIPHYVKRKDGQLMCFAGMWDRVRFEDEEKELYTYTIITTDSNKQIGFLHDRMPVILNNGSPEMFSWLDASKQEWSKELQSLLKPYDGELECYPVSKDVGKVGNDSASFIVPLKDNKQSINNFFSNQHKAESQHKPSDQTPTSSQQASKVEHKPDEHRDTEDAADAETNAPKPTTGTKRDHEDDTTDAVQTADQPDSKRAKTSSPTETDGPAHAEKAPQPSPTKSKASKQTPAKHTPKSSPQKSSQGSPKPDDGSMKITSFFNK